jgi:hypothetical protein
MRKARAELFVERRKLVFYNLGALVLAFAVWWALIQFSSQGSKLYDYRAMVVLVTIVYAVMSVKTWEYFRRSPRLKLYDDGAELDHLGFWGWEDISAITPSAKGPIFILKAEGRDLSHAWKSRKSYSYEYNSENNLASVILRFRLS